MRNSLRWICFNRPENSIQIEMPPSFSGLRYAP